jgi:hypothetical protein
MDSSEQPVWNTGGAKNKCGNCTPVQIASRQCCMCLSYTGINQYELRSQNLAPVLFHAFSRYKVRKYCKTVTGPVFR